jgi:hypothetical protein
MLIEQAFLLVLIAVTSAAACALGVRRLGLGPDRLGAAVLFVFQLVGMSTVFFVANLAVGLVCVLVVRGATGTFVSAYLLNDVTLCLLSALQGVCFECWRTGAGTAHR